MHSINDNRIPHTRAIPIIPYGLTFSEADGTARPTQQFWEAWPDNKVAVKKQGFYVRKTDGKWRVIIGSPLFAKRERREHQSYVKIDPSLYPLTPRDAKDRALARLRARKAVQA